jgi:hypothetical protein
MSAIMETRPASAHGAPARAAVARPVTLARVVRSEWTRLRALRSTWWCALIAVVLIVGLGAAIAGSGTPYKISAGNSAAGGVTVSLVGVLFAQLVLGMLGVLAFQRRICHRDDQGHASRSAVAAACAVGEADRAGGLDAAVEPACRGG